MDHSWLSENWDYTMGKIGCCLELWTFFGCLLVPPRATVNANGKWQQAATCRTSDVVDPLEKILNKLRSWWRDHRVRNKDMISINYGSMTISFIVTRTVAAILFFFLSFFFFFFVFCLFRAAPMTYEGSQATGWISCSCWPTPHPWQLGSKRCLWSTPQLKAMPDP